MARNNAKINARLIDLLNIIDARASVNIFVLAPGEDRERNIKYDLVYEILTDKDFMRQYKSYEVIGLNIGLVNNILIKEGLRKWIER